MRSRCFTLLSVAVVALPLLSGGCTVRLWQSATSRLAHPSVECVVADDGPGQPRRALVKYDMAVPRDFMLGETFVFRRDFYALVPLTNEDRAETAGWLWISDAEREQIVQSAAAHTGRREVYALPDDVARPDSALAVGRAAALTPVTLAIDAVTVPIVLVGYAGSQLLTSDRPTPSPAGQPTTAATQPGG